MLAAHGSSGPSDQTSLFIAGSVAGDLASRNLLVQRFTPVLLAQARYRMRSFVHGVDPEDLVQETWAIALPKLRDLQPRDEQWTPVLLKFLSVVLLRLVNAQLRRSLRRRGGDIGQGAHSPEGGDPLQQVPAEVSGIVTRLAREQSACVVQTALQELPEAEREVVLLRGIEQLPNREVARLLGIDDSTVTRRYQAALLRLRERLPDSVFAELS